MADRRTFLKAIAATALLSTPPARAAASDRVRVDQYLVSFREIERQIQRAETAASDGAMPDFDRPVGVPAAFAVTVTVRDSPGSNQK